MKLSKIIFTTLLIILTVGTAFAQKAAIGLRAGTTYFTLDNEEINDAAKYTLGVDVAIPIEFAISTVFSIQPEVHFTQKGTQFESTQNGQEQTVAVKTNYIELPIALKANFGAKKIRGYAFVAPSLGYATNRFTVEKLGDTDRAKEEVDFITAEDAQSQRWEFSTTGGIGASMKAGVGSFVVDVRYSLGLTDNTKFEDGKPDGWIKTTNRGCTLSMGYMIPIGGK